MFVLDCRCNGAKFFFHKCNQKKGFEQIMKRIKKHDTKWFLKEFHFTFETYSLNVLIKRPENMKIKNII